MTPGHYCITPLKNSKVGYVQKTLGAASIRGLGPSCTFSKMKRIYSINRILRPNARISGILFKGAVCNTHRWAVHKK